VAAQLAASQEGLNSVSKYGHHVAEVGSPACYSEDAAFKSRHGHRMLMNAALSRLHFTLLGAGV
jgi:hypothetical protein